MWAKTHSSVHQNTKIFVGALCLGGKQSATQPDHLVCVDVSDVNAIQKPFFPLHPTTCGRYFEKT